MKFFIEVREINNDGKIDDILYFEHEPNADNYIKNNNKKCIKHKHFLISKDRNVNDFKKERTKLKALDKLTDEEREILGL